MASWNKLGSHLLSAQLEAVLLPLLDLSVLGHPSSLSVGSFWLSPGPQVAVLWCHTSKGRPKGKGCWALPTVSLNSPWLITNMVPNPGVTRLRVGKDAGASRVIPAAFLLPWLCCVLKEAALCIRSLNKDLSSFWSNAPGQKGVDKVCWLKVRGFIDCFSPDGKPVSLVHRYPAHEVLWGWS